jgi:nucleotide-binding universal stress UspA family protein
MYMIQKIFVPFDFSDNARQALTYAHELAGFFAAEIVLFHAIALHHYDVNERDIESSYQEVLREHEAQVHDQLTAQSKQVGNRNIRIHTLAQRGFSVAEMILANLHESQADLLVMGTHGRTGLRHALQGSTAEKVIRNASVPVITLRQGEQPKLPGHLLLPIDFSGGSSALISYAAGLASTLSLRITLVHVVEMPVHPAYYASGVGSVFELDKELAGRIRDNLSHHAAAGGLTKNVHYEVREGIAHAEIVALARQQSADMILIGRRGLSALEHVLLGSTAEKVVRHAPMPVLSMRS